MSKRVRSIHENEAIRDAYLEDKKLTRLRRVRSALIWGLLLNIFGLADFPLEVSLIILIEILGIGVANLVIAARRSKIEEDFL